MYCCWNGENCAAKKGTGIIFTVTAPAPPPSMQGVLLSKVMRLGDITMRVCVEYSVFLYVCVSVKRRRYVGMRFEVLISHFFIGYLWI